MEEFDELQNLWKQTETPAPQVKTNPLKIKTIRMKLQHTQNAGAALLIFTGILILALMAAFDTRLHTLSIISAMSLVSLVCFLQAGLMLFTAQKIKRIDVAQPPALHLKQWLRFREFQKKLRHWNMPVYYALLSVALAVYLYQMLKNADPWKIILAFAITYAWMFFAYFYLGRREVKKQDAKMDAIISELKNLENQFQ